MTAQLACDALQMAPVAASHANRSRCPFAPRESILFRLSVLHGIAGLSALDKVSRRRTIELGKLAGSL